MTIKDFHVGRQIIFPTEEDIQQGFHVIDRDAAQLFFEVMQYYRAFEQEFNRQTQFIMRQLRNRKLGVRANFSGGPLYFIWELTSQTTALHHQ